MEDKAPGGGFSDLWSRDCAQFWKVTISQEEEDCWSALELPEIGKDATTVQKRDRRLHQNLTKEVALNRDLILNGFSCEPILEQLRNGMVGFGAVASFMVRNIACASQRTLQSMCASSLEAVGKVEAFCKAYLCVFGYDICGEHFLK